MSLCRPFGKMVAQGEGEDAGGDFCASAAKEGHTSLLRWATAKNFDFRDADVCARAAEGGNLGIVQWLR